MTCKPCGKLIEFRLAQPLEGTEPEWLSELHQCFEAVDIADHEDLLADAHDECLFKETLAELESPTKERRMAYGDTLPYAGVWTHEQRLKYEARQGFDPVVNPMLTPAEEVVWSDPLISCVMPTTAKRLWCIERSIACFLKQTYEACELVIVTDGEDAEKVVAVIPSHPRIRHVHLDGSRSLGEKYNAMIELVDGPYIALWADDDWNHPRRLEAVMRAMQQAKMPVGGTNTMLAWRASDRQAWLYWNEPTKPYLIGGTIIFHKRIWQEAGGFPDWRRGSDSEFAKRALFPGQGRDATGWAVVNDPRLYIAFVHGGNTGNPLDEADGKYDDRVVFTKLEGEEANMARHLGADAAAFGF